MSRAPNHFSSLDQTFSLLVSIVTTLLVIFAVLALAGYFYHLVTLLGIVLVITYILLGPVELVTRIIQALSGKLHGVLWLRRLVLWTPVVNPRVLAVIVVYFIFFAGVSLVAVELMPRLATQSGQLSRSFSRQISQASGAIIDWSDERVGATTLKKLFKADIEQARKDGRMIRPEASASPSVAVPAQTEGGGRPQSPPAKEHISAEEKQVIQESVVKTTVSQGINLLESTLSKAVANALALVTGTLNGVIYLLAGVLLTFYFLADGPKLYRDFLNTLSGSAQNTVSYLAGRFHQAMFSFIKGQLMLGILTGIYMFIIYTIFGLPYALLLSSFFGIAELLPVVGTYLGLTPGLLVSLFTLGPLKTVLIWLCSYLYQTFKDNILGPKVVGEAMGLHPLVVMLSLLICAKTMGVLGILFALPLASLLHVTLRYFITDEELRENL